MGLALLLAVLTDRLIKSAGVYQTLFIWPYAVAPAISGVLWMFMFDTQLLHRGSYDTANDSRVILHMEFSVPGKHSISRGPIGTKEFNAFSFAQELYKIKSFKMILDRNRLKFKNNNYFYSN